MGLFERKPKSGQHFAAIFDIGSGSIGGAFVQIGGEKTPEIIFTARKDIPFQEKLNFDRFLDSMIHTLDELFHVMKKGVDGIKITEVHCVLASPWYASQTRLVRYNQETPFVVTEKGISKLVDKEIDLFRNSKFFTHAKQGDTPPEIMEAKNIQMKLNGYEVSTPFGKKVTELEMAVYISLIPAHIRAEIEGAITKFWHIHVTRFSSFSFAAFDNIRSIFPDVSGFLFVDVAGEVTDISLAKNNILLESISFPSGKNMLIRALVRQMKTTPGAANTELELYTKGKSTPEHVKQIEKILTETVKEWQASFEGVVARLATEFPIPHAIFYTADDSVTKWFEDAIKGARVSQFGDDETTFIVRSLGIPFLSKFVDIAEPDFEDPFLAIEAIFVNRYSSLLK